MAERHAAYGLPDFARGESLPEVAFDGPIASNRIFSCWAAWIFDEQNMLQGKPDTASLIQK